MEDEPRAPQAWIDAIAEAEADVAAGRVVSGKAVLRRLNESIVRMQAAKASSVPDAADRTIPATR